MYEKYFEEAANVARHATCYRARCGSVIVLSGDIIIGRGYNGTPLGDETQRMCGVDYRMDRKPKSDKTCCVHAEWNAIIDALQNYPAEIEGSTLYFMRIADDDSMTDAGHPYCTVCSRLALQSGLKWFGLWNSGPELIDTKKYNRLSYDFYR